MSKMGLEVISFTIKEVRDKNEYTRIWAAGCGADQARRGDGDCRCGARHGIKRATALRESAVAKAQADQERVIAETASQTRQAEAQRDSRSRRRSTPTKPQATGFSGQGLRIADQHHAAAGNAEQVKVQQVEKEGQIKVQEAEILRHEKELIATILKGSEIERQRIENMASAEKNRLTTEAEGRLPRFVRRAKPKPTSSSRRARRKRSNECEGRGLQEWNQAAVVDKLVDQHGGCGSRHGRAAEQGGSHHDRVHG